MKHKKPYQLNASFGLVMFVMLGYLVKFFPNSLTNVDSSIQQLIRRNLSATSTSFFKQVTHFGSARYVVIILGLLLLLFLFKKWYTEAIFLTVNVAMAPILVTILKYVYARQRPSLPHLVVEKGLSFPSGHAAVSIMLYVTLMVICRQRIKHQYAKNIPLVLAVIIVGLIGMSRIYLGVHYPTDILGGWLISGSWLLFWFPVYDEFRFKWRFKGVQK